MTIRYTAANGNRSARLAINISLTAPKLELVPGDDSILLSWTSSIHANSFEIYRKESGQSGDGDLMATTEDHSYMDTDILSGHTYTYRIKATDTEHGVSAWSDWSADVEIAASTIEITIPEPDDIGLVISSMDDEISQGTVIDVSIQDISGLETYQWFVNGSPITDEMDISEGFSFIIPEECVEYIPMQVLQELMLVLTDENGSKYSGSMWITLRLS